VENKLQLRGSYESSPPCIMYCLSNCVLQLCIASEIVYCTFVLPLVQLCIAKPELCVCVSDDISHVSLIQYCLSICVLQLCIASLLLMQYESYSVCLRF